MMQCTRMVRAGADNICYMLIKVNTKSSVMRLTPNNFTASAKCTTVPTTLTLADICILAGR